ncbi:MAG: BCCT family transporter [Pseudomonadota bacterium]
MPLKAPFTDVKIKTEEQGFYQGFNIPIALVSKFAISLLVVWAAVWPANANDALSFMNAAALEQFNTVYIYSVGFFTLFGFTLALIPRYGSRRLGKPDERPEFSTFSWFSMMFGAGLGVALMVYATGEPLLQWGSNPETVLGNHEGYSAAAVTSAYRYTFLHNGFHAWSIYVVAAISMAYYSYTRDMPLTLRSALTPILGERTNGVLGHSVDILGMVATILGVAVTIGYGINQLVDGAYSITGIDWLVQPGSSQTTLPLPSTEGLLMGLVLIMAMSILSAVSGVGRGVKYLSNLNMVLSVVLLLTFVFFGSFAYAMEIYATNMLDYLQNFLTLSFTAYDTSTEVGQWQQTWTTFYWAWWIAFAPFVGLFLARISRGRTIREFVLGAVIAPALVCFAWMTILGGTAIDLEMSGVAQGDIINASTTSSLFVTLQTMFGDTMQFAMTVLCVVLILTFLVTSADSGVLVLNTIMAGGNIDTGIPHRIIWGIILTLVIATLLIAGGGGLGALQNAMILGALPFTVVMVLMCLSLVKALVRDHLRSM